MCYNYPKEETFLFVDVETSDLANDTICAIGVVIVKNGEEKAFYSLINPNVHIANTFIHGISDEDVVGAPTFSEFWPMIENEAGDNYIVVGHNVSFDVCAIMKDLKRYGINFEKPERKIDTMAVAKDILYNFEPVSGDLKLNTICDKLKINLNHHNAESDITATKQALEILLTIGSRDVLSFVNKNCFSPKKKAVKN